MLSLHGYRRNVPSPARQSRPRPGTRVDPAVAAVVADPILCDVVDHGCVVNVVNVDDVHVVDGTVVEEMSVVPAPALVAFAEISEAVINPAIETYVRPPVAFMEKKSVAAPTPITGRPEVADLRSLDPCAGHPVVVADIVVVGPVAGRPDIAIAGASRLLVHGQRGRADSDRDADLRRRCQRNDDHYRQRLTINEWTR